MRLRRTLPGLISTMPRALLAWEGGVGRGHIFTLKTVAEAIGDRFSFDAALCLLTRRPTCPLCDAVFQGPWLPYLDSYRKAQGNPPASDLVGDISQTRSAAEEHPLVAAGHAGPRHLARHRRLRALRAAGGAWPRHSKHCGRRRLSVPPPDTELFPVCFRVFRLASHQEAEIVELVNSVVVDFGVPKARPASPGLCLQ